MNWRMIGLVIVVISGFTLLALAQPCSNCPGCAGSKMGDPKPGCCPMPTEEGMGPGPDGPPTGFGMGPGMGPGRMLEKGNVEVIRGRIASIEPGPRGGMKLMVESDSRLIPVIIGPVRPMEIKEDLKKNDWVEVTGMRMMRGDRSGIVARKIRLEFENEKAEIRPHDVPPPEMAPRMMKKRHAY